MQWDPRKNEIMNQNTSSLLFNLHSHWNGMEERDHVLFAWHVAVTYMSNRPVLVFLKFFPNCLHWKLINTKYDEK